MAETKVFLVTRALIPNSVEQREELPTYISPVAAGFPFPAEDYVDRNLDLHEHLVRNRATTFFLCAAGNAMLGASIHDGDLLVVDRSVEARNGSVVIAAVKGELTVKYIRRSSKELTSRGFISDLGSKFLNFKTQNSFSF
jgi:DNA polymerase V